MLLDFALLGELPGIQSDIFEKKTCNLFDFIASI